MGYSIYKIFIDLKERETVSKNGVLAASLPFNNKHKIGVSPDGCPMFFIECKKSPPSLDVNLELISVSFNRVCRLFEADGQIDSIYTIISLKTANINFQQYFIEVVCLVLKQLPENPSHKQLKIEVQKLVEMFSRFNRPPSKTIQGLWAELLIIEQAKQPEYLIQSWHVTPDDKFDFNDGQDKIEVKSTSKARRVHNFAIEQLKPNCNSNLLIASVFAIQTGHGKNIFDLKKSICKRVQNLHLQFLLDQIIAQTLGCDFEKAIEVYFDYQQALDTLSFYDFKDIPTIHSENIPNEISNVRLDCDLSHVPTIKDKVFDTSHSSLYRSIKI